MPELPEVETVTRSIAPLVGRRILTAEFRCLRVLRGGDPGQMARRIQGRKIAGVKRYGKFILVSLEGGGYLVIHLGMTGRLLLGGPMGKHTHAILTLDLETMEYRERREPEIASINEALKIESLGRRLEFVLPQDDKAGALARHIVYNSLAYAARRVPEITDQIINVDLSAEDLRWVVCPVCHQHLQLQNATVRCQSCGRRYPIVDGIPILLTDRAI